jgi:S-DNA-T family DNA segregation ATPase FtsK/SpoIIIE
MPHLLVAGMTRAGKSVGINSILGGLLLTKTPDELKLILVILRLLKWKHKWNSSFNNSRYK